VTITQTIIEPLASLNGITVLLTIMTCRIDGGLR